MRKLCILLMLLSGLSASSQVKIGSTGTPNANAVLELDGGINKGLLLPRISTTDMNSTAFSAAPNGLLIYNLTDGFLYVRKASAWQKVTDATNNGLTLPFSGTASSLGGAEFSITHTGSFGDAVYFTNTAGGSAITTNAGNNKLNMTSGNTGIGIPSGLFDNPTLGKLVVRGTVGAVSAMFGDQAAGVSIMNNLPSIGFNTYYSSGNKAITTGFGSAVGIDNSSGRFYITSSPTSSSAAGAAMTLTERIAILPNGYVGIGTTPAYLLDVAGRMRLAADANTAGIWLNDAANTAAVSFIGQYSDTKFGIYGAGGWKFAVDNIDGTVYCGTPNLDAENQTNGVGYKLKVFGKIISEEVRVQLKGTWPDYVFNKDYKLTPLAEVEKFINENKHLQGINKAAVIEKEGADLGDMQRKLLEKVEELTLYLIDANKKIDELKVEMEALKKIK